MPLLIAIAYFVKVVSALLFRWRFTWSERLAADFLLSSRLSKIIAVSAIALEIGAISPAIQSAIALVAIITCTTSPLIFNRLYRGGTTEQRRAVILIGEGQMTELLATRLERSEQELVVISTHQTLTEQLQKMVYLRFWARLLLRD